MTTNPSLPPVDTHDAVYAIEHVAALFHVKVDTARGYTHRTDFPAAHQLGARLLWDRADILAWFRSLPRLTLVDRQRAASARAADAPTAPRDNDKPIWPHCDGHSQG